MKNYFEMLWYLITEQLDGIYFYQIELVLIISGIIAVIPGFILVKLKKKSLFDALLLYCSIAYFGVILLITIIRREAGSRVWQIDTKLHLGLLNGGPLQKRQALYCILNVMLFVPFSFLLMLLRREEATFKNVFMTVLLCFTSSAFIEIIQLLTSRGNFEITDLLMNVTGGITGALLGLFVIKCIGNRKAELK